jgi:hypothetical protein
MAFFHRIFKQKKGCKQPRGSEIDVALPPTPKPQYVMGVDENCETFWFAWASYTAAK